MTKYYHITSYENLESISQKGLIPSRGSRTRSIGDKRNAIFLSLGIHNAILMYGTLLYHYNSYAGNRGLKAINFYKNKMNEYRKMAKIIPLDQDDIAEMEAITEVIVWIKEIMEYKDFSEYIGNGVYLTISEITDINSSDEKDCYTTQIISPEKIKVVLLKNKKTGEILDNREQILAYFMSVTPMKSILDNIHNVVTKKIIKDLYESKLNDIRYYGSNNFEIEEIPIDLYVNKNQKFDEISKRI